MGLNEPILVQMKNWFTNIIHSNFGNSVFLRMPVTQAIIMHLGPKLYLTLLALSMSVVLGIISGVIASSHHNSIIDQLIMVVTSLGVAIPNFWLALMLC